MITKLNQIIAIEKGIKARAASEITDLYKAAQKPDLFSGFAKDYYPVDAEGEALPAERKRVQHTVADMLRTTERVMGELFSIVARKDYTNCVAKADVKLPDGTVVVKDAPVSFLLFLEKQLTDLRTFVGSLPVLDEADDWTLDANSALYKTGEVRSHRTKKVQKPIVLYQSTPEHPAQTQLITEDVIVGFWHQVKHSGGMPKTRKVDIASRVETLLAAVKQAREAANMQDEAPAPVASAMIFNYLFGG